VDVPALLPDGTPAPSSISATLKARGDVIDSSSFQLDNVDTTVTEER
jgi:NADH-quinone oxidoreductase subunit J